MHKAKGREFDNVFILLPEKSKNSDAEMRLIYVALTRAKKNLAILTDGNRFDHIKADNLTHTQSNRNYDEPEFLTLYPSHRDVYLDFFTREKTVFLLSKKMAGEALYYNEKAHALCDRYKNEVCVFSVSFRKELDQWAKRGYQIDKAETEYVVNWFRKEDERIYRVLLPRIGLLRNFKY